MIKGDIFAKIYKQMAHKRACLDVPVIEIEMLAAHGKEGQPAILKFDKCTSHEAEVALEQEFGNRSVAVRHGDYGSPEHYVAHRNEIQMTIGGFLASASSSDHLYMANQQASFAFLRALTGSILDDLGGEAMFEEPTIWLGRTGAVTPLHKDSTDNFAFHVFGKKKWILFSPSDAPLLKLRNVNDRPDSEFCVSSHDLREPGVLQGLIDLSACPTTCQVGTGECLYIPAGWSHFVETEELTLMVNIWQKGCYPARLLQ